MQLTREFISLLTGQDRKAQYELYKLCYGKMKGVCLRYQQDEQNADDVLNRAFLKILSAISTFDKDKDFMPWLVRITINENLDSFRRNHKLKSVVEFDSERVESDLDLNQFEFNEAEERLNAEQLIKLIDLLPNTTRQVFNLFVIDGFKHHEIGDLLEISAGTSKWHLNSARKKMKQMILQIAETEKIVHYGE